MISYDIYPVLSDLLKPTCPLTEEWINKLWHIYTVEYYSAIKKNEIMPLTVTWIDLESILSGIRWTEKDKSHIISLI